MIWLTVQITNCLKRCVLQIIPCTTCSHHIVQLTCVYVVILSGCLNTVLICIRNHSLFELCINILNDIVLVLFCSCYVFIVCLISFATYIITNYTDDVRLSHLNKDYLLTYLLIVACVRLLHVRWWWCDDLSDLLNKDLISTRRVVDTSQSSPQRPALAPP